MLRDRRWIWFLVPLKRTYRANKPLFEIPPWPRIDGRSASPFATNLQAPAGQKIIAETNSRTIISEPENNVGFWPLYIALFLILRSFSVLSSATEAISLVDAMMPFVASAGSPAPASRKRTRLFSWGDWRRACQEEWKHGCGSKNRVLTP